MQTQVNYGYREDGRIESYTANNGVETTYNYDTNSITVTEQTDDEPATRIAVTVYNYEAGQASDETWVTRWADPEQATPAEDQKTVYTMDYTGATLAR